MSHHLKEKEPHNRRVKESQAGLGWPNWGPGFFRDDQASYTQGASPILKGLPLLFTSTLTTVIE